MSADHDAASDVHAGRAAPAAALKMHLRVVDVAGTVYRVVSLRPATRARFSSNLFHEAWHILVGRDGAALLARILWGLAYQRQPGTLFWIDTPHLVPTPFEADPADPIAIIPAGLTSIDADRMRGLRRALRHAATRTIRWHTFGIERALDARDDRSRRREDERLGRGERMSRLKGVVCFTTPPALLRSNALGLVAMARDGRDSYLPLAASSRGRWSPDGEVQLIPTFTADVASARVARREVLGVRPIASWEERVAVWDRKLVVERRRGSRTIP